MKFFYTNKDKYIDVPDGKSVTNNHISYHRTVGFSNVTAILIMTTQIIVDVLLQYFNIVNINCKDQSTYIYILVNIVLVVLTLLFRSKIVGTTWFVPKD